MSVSGSTEGNINNELFVDEEAEEQIQLEWEQYVRNHDDLDLTDPYVQENLARVQAMEIQALRSMGIYVSETLISGLSADGDMEGIAMMNAARSLALHYVSEALIGELSADDDTDGIALINAFYEGSDDNPTSVDDIGIALLALTPDPDDTCFSEVFSNLNDQA